MQIDTQAGILYTSIREKRLFFNQLNAFQGTPGCLDLDPTKEGGYVIKQSDSDSETLDEIGRAYNGTYDCTGNIVEIIRYDRTLTTAERQQVETYLNTKYNIY